MKPIHYDDCRIMVKSTCPNPMISVLVAIYNMEQNGLLARCLASFESQIVKNVEYVLVDDASQDKSCFLAVDWASKRSDTTVVSMLQNKRQGAARNRGIDMARGQYLAIVDADDMLPEDFFKQITETIESTHADVIVPGLIQRIDMDDNKLSEPISNVPDESVLGALDKYKRKKMILNPWSLSINQRRLFDDAKNLYPEGMLYEDTPTAIRWYFSYKSVACASKAIYLYRVNPHSTTHITGFDEAALADRMKSCDLILDNATELGVIDEYRDELEEYYVRVCLCNTLGMFAQAKVPVAKARDLGKHVRSRVPRYPNNPYISQGILHRAKSLLRWRFTAAYYACFLLKRRVSRNRWIGY